ncbi:viral A-type inclusion protein repeat protein [Pseudozyma hubeiensis SY62]|uniref:Viral A-type inclusion protein repeat protein n=1 Tax=Pseudozyma hubeiensis (strain SY62) TaxID=1305764 RepID=R9PIT7_PSEHS|nr:viral A-type inclusion protein repeat protein [Pseudozyma hubeiensis SY62]GAC98025.1 viral A-type inclusion protein repeat protein [Pseudozyma hubeiensis SY62]
MMSEVSFSSNLDLSTTPIVRSRRISCLPLDPSTLTSPTKAKDTLQTLRLENVALIEELNNMDEQLRQLQAEKASSSSLLHLSSSSSTDSLPDEHRYSAENRSAKRLLHRLIAKLASQEEVMDVDETFELDRSMVVDPERSILEPGRTTHLSTPNGKNRVARRFEGDLLDDIGLLGEALKERAGRVGFATAEREAELRSVKQRNEMLAEKLARLESELKGMRSAADDDGDSERMAEKLSADILAAQQREADLQSQLLTAQAHSTDLERHLAQTTAKLDQLSAEQDLIISAAAKKSSAHIEALTLQLAEQSSTTPAASSGVDSDRVHELESQLDLANASLLSLQSEHCSLQTQLEQRRSATNDVQVMLDELKEKRERLFAVQSHNERVRWLEKVVGLQQRIVQLLDRQEGGEEWVEYANQLREQLATLKEADTPVPVKERKDAAVEASMTTVDEKRDEVVMALKGEVEELEARVLRRNEQIGSLQRQLKGVENDLARSRTNQLLAEETVDDLESEREEQLETIRLLEEQVAQLQSSKSSSSSSSSSSASAVDPDMQTAAADVVVDETALIEARETISGLETKLESLSEENATLLGQKQALEQDIVSLTERIQHHSTVLTESKALDEQRDEEITTLKQSLLTSTDRLTSTQADLSSLTLQLAEHREFASTSTERISTLESDLHTLSTTHAALLASSSTTQSELDTAVATIATLTSERDEHRSKCSSLESGLQELLSKHAELDSILAAKDEALTQRNSEYWSLKEELAELQEEAERSRGEIALLAEVQERLEGVTREKSEMEMRVAAQEEALLRLKGDVASARSTEEMLNEQYVASQRRVKDLESIVASLEGEARQGEQDSDLQAKLSEAQTEVQYLTSRIDELGEELGRKAEEIEEADSKILDALKESKKYATRYNKLSAKFETLQTEVKAKEEEVRKVEEVLKGERERVKALMMEKEMGGSSGMVRSSSGGVAGRKRSKPDHDDEAAREEDGESEATPYRKAVYAPSPSARTMSASSFTPVRRAAVPLKRSHHTKPTNTTPVVLGHATPPPGGMVRSTSNPSELIAQRLHASPSAPTPKPLLSDKTNLAPGGGGAAGVSRLSSKGERPEMAVKPSKKGLTSLLPSSEEKKVLAGGTAAAAAGAGAAAGGGAADFLARMKAQRAAAAAQRA